MPFRAVSVVLSQEEDDELECMSVSRSLPAGDVFRARLVLMLAAGRYAEIQDRLNTTAPTISLWKNRFLEYRVDGLMQERHPGQKPTVITSQLQAKVLAATRRKPKDGSTHWSCRKLAHEIGVSKDTVHRIWRIAGLRPHRLERYMASNDPDFESKAADIIGLYLNPPQHAAVFCVDEKSAIQKQMQTQRRADSRPPLPHQDEFPAEYSLAGCSPAEPASASSAMLILNQTSTRWLLFFSQRQLSPNSTVSSHDAGHAAAPVPLSALAARFLRCAPDSFS